LWKLSRKCPAGASWIIAKKSGDGQMQLHLIFPAGQVRRMARVGTMDTPGNLRTPRATGLLLRTLHFNYDFFTLTLNGIDTPTVLGGPNDLG
jgi:hypothetical protein